MTPKSCDPRAVERLMRIIARRNKMSDERAVDKRWQRYGVSRQEVRPMEYHPHQTVLISERQ